MKVWTVKVLNDIQNNYQGIDDIEVYVFDTRSKAIAALVNRSLRAINFMIEAYHNTMEDLEIEERNGFFHVNDQNNYITIKIEEKEVL